jgi:hypothetical protein
VVLPTDQCTDPALLVVQVAIPLPNPSLHSLPRFSVPIFWHSDGYNLLLWPEHSVTRFISFKLSWSRTSNTSLRRRSSRRTKKISVTRATWPFICIVKRFEFSAVIKLTRSRLCCPIPIHPVRIGQDGKAPVYGNLG